MATKSKPNQRVHVSDETHAAAKAFCRAHGLRMHQWVGELVNDAAARGWKPVIEELKKRRSAK